MRPFIITKLFGRNRGVPKIPSPWSGPVVVDPELEHILSRLGSKRTVAHVFVGGFNQKAHLRALRLTARHVRQLFGRKR